MICSAIASAMADSNAGEKRPFVSAGDKRSHFSRNRPDPVRPPERAPVGGEAVSTLQQFLNFKVSLATQRISADNCGGDGLPVVVVKAR
jgi:hypothetical protein